MKATLLFLLIALLTSCQLAKELTPKTTLLPFTSDGCSLSPNGTKENPNAFLECCMKHDLAYWQGGPLETRKQADLDLKSCIAKNSDEEHGSLYWLGTDFGGSPHFKTSFRWAYGWTQYQGYTELTPEQKKAVEQQMQQVQWQQIYNSLAK